MIHRLRRRHRRIVAALAFALPALYGAALAVRRPPPRQALPPGLAAPPRPRGAPAARYVAPGLVAAVWRDAGDSTPALEVELASELEHPDVLVYWTPGRSAIVGATGVDTPGRLLGSLAGARRHRFALSAADVRDGGTIAFLSLPHGALLGELRLPAAERGTPGP